MAASDRQSSVAIRAESPMPADRTCSVRLFDLHKRMDCNSQDSKRLGEQFAIGKQLM